MFKYKQRPSTKEYETFYDRIDWKKGKKEDKKDNKKPKPSEKQT